MYRSSVLLQFCLVGLFAQLGTSGRLKPLDGTRENTCPGEGVIKPCVCTSDDLNLYLDCSEAKTIEELEHAFREPYPDEEFYSLTIDQTACGTNCSLTSLPDGVLGNSTTFIEILITGTQIEAIDDKVFNASYETLDTLRLPTNLINNFSLPSIVRYPELKHLYLQQNGFDTLELLDDLESEQLITVNLNSNSVLVSPSFISKCPSIRQLHLRNTRMKEVPIFDLSPISMFTGLQNIEWIDFGANSLTEIQANTIVADADTLTMVDFSENNISVVHPGFISGFSSDETSTLIMSENSITILDQMVWTNIFIQLPHENSVDLSSNPLLCGCDIAWLVRSPLKNSLTDTTTCSDGITVVKELPEALYENC